MRSRSLELEDYLLLTAVLLLPWAFGGVEIWAYRGAALLLVASATVALWKRGLDGWGLARGGARWLLPAFLLAAWGAVQLLPMPPGAIRVLSPATHRFYVEAFPGYASGNAGGAELLEEEALARVPEARDRPLPDGPQPVLALEPLPCLDRGFRPLTLQPSATEERFFWYLALLLGFLVLRTRVADRERHQVYLAALFVSFAALAVFGLVQAQTWNGKLYWVRALRVKSNPFGPYVNPNNFAGVMEFAVPALAAYAWTRFLRVGRAALYEARFGAAAVAAAICFAAGLATASKVAAMLLVGSLLTLALIGARTWLARLVIAGVSVIVVVSGAYLLAGTELGERARSYLARAQQADLLEGRSVVWDAGWSQFRDFPLTGSGFGTFREVFPGYMPAGALARWEQAHNDYLELMLDGGIVAMLLVLWLGWAYGSRVVKGVRRSLSLGSMTRLGLALGVLALSLHAFVDFNHQIPANALMFVAVGAMALPGRGGDDEP